MLFLLSKYITNPSQSFYLFCNHGPSHSLLSHRLLQIVSMWFSASNFDSLTHSLQRAKEILQEHKLENYASQEYSSYICLIGVLCLEHCVLCLINSYSSLTIKFSYSFQNPDHQFSSFLTRLGWISVCVPKVFYASLHQEHFISFTMLRVTCLHSVVLTRLWVA